MLISEPGTMLLICRFVFTILPMNLEEKSGIFFLISGLNRKCFEFVILFRRIMSLEVLNFVFLQHESHETKWSCRLCLRQADWAREGKSVGIDTAPQHGEPPLFCAHLQGFSPGGAPAAGSPPGRGSGEGSPKEFKVGGGLTPPTTGKDRSTIILEERAAQIDIEEVCGICTFLFKKIDQRTRIYLHTHCHVITRRRSGSL
jgi:hypothetical protein